MGKYASRNEEGDHRVKEDDPKAIALLKEEHQIFRVLFDRAEEQEGKALRATSDELCMRLAVHMTIEEEILYPVGRKAGDAEEVNEGVVEHAAGKALMAEIEQMTGEEELFKAKVHVLGEQTIHHIDEEDEDLFEEMKSAHAEGRIDLDAIGEQLRARQAELYDRIAETAEMGPTDEAQANEVESVEER